MSRYFILEHLLLHFSDSLSIFCFHFHNISANNLTIVAICHLKLNPLSSKTDKNSCYQFFFVIVVVIILINL